MLWHVSNGTGNLVQDKLMEKSLETVLNEVVKPRINQGQEILGTKLDPVWLFPIGPILVKKRKIFKVNAKDKD